MGFCNDFQTIPETKDVPITENKLPKLKQEKKIR